jgi:hypothetical protein
LGVVPKERNALHAQKALWKKQLFVNIAKHNNKEYKKMTRYQYEELTGALLLFLLALFIFLSGFFTGCWITEKDNSKTQVAER